MSKKHIQESRLFDSLQKNHGYRIRALETGMVTDHDVHPMVRDRATGVCTSLVSFIVSVPRDSSMGEAFEEFYGKLAEQKAKKRKMAHAPGRRRA